MNKITDCVILAAGFGSRALPLTKFCPKPLFPLGNGTLLDYTIRLALSNKLKIHVIGGYMSEIVRTHIKNKQVDVNYIEVDELNTNLFDSLIKSKKFITNSNFLWIGSGVIFKPSSIMKEIISTHSKGDFFCTLFYQNKYKFRPKLIINNQKLVEFNIGNSSSKISAPTIYAVSSIFFDFCSEFKEEIVFQKAIDNGLNFNAIPFTGISREVHTLEDYYAISKMLYPTGYSDESSIIQSSQVKNSFIYKSNIKNSVVENSIIINADISGLNLKNKVIYMDKVEYELNNQNHG